MSILNGYEDASLLDLPMSSVTASSLKAQLKGLASKLQARYDLGEPIRNLVRGRAWAMDQLLIEAWQSLPWSSDQIGLLAVGGYGRGELLPHSDIDLLILADSEHTITDNQTSIEQFLMLLWDSKLKIGHSVRSIHTCQEEARADVTIITNLIESRQIAGSSTLADQLNDAISERFMWSSRDFFRAKLNEQQHRHEKYDDTEYNLEPNIKSSPGGLRDLQTIGWIARRHSGSASFRSFLEKGYLTDGEYRSLLDCQAFLWQVRWALHSTTNRPEDRLRLDLQRQIADLFGYDDENGKLAVERLMQRYFRVVFELSALNELLLRHLEDEIIGPPNPGMLIEINSRFRISDGYIEAKSNEVFKRTPSALLEIFVLAAQYHEQVSGIKPNTMRAIRANLHRIDGPFRNDIRNTSMFMELIRSPLGVNTNLRRMGRLGVLGKWIPEFGRIEGQMQYDLFHVYTVDAHTLLTVRNLRKFRHRSNTQKFPIATQIIHELGKKELVYLAALFHDIGKGRGGDHSELGAFDALRFCERHRLSKPDTDLVVWLVEHHLLMSLTSQREDLSDPEVIRQFCLKVRDQRRLNYLYVLTVADIYATNPALWTSWRASLLKQLFDEAKRALRRGLENPIDRQDLIAETQTKALEILEKDGFSADEVCALWGEPGEDYFLRESPENIAWHTKSLMHSSPDAPVVLMKETDEDGFAGATQIFIYAPDRPHLFADIVTTLDALELNIQDARIMTSSGSHFSLDTFIVLEQDGRSIGENFDRMREIQHTLLLMLSDKQPPKRAYRRMPTRLKHFHVPPRVTISNDLHNERTVVEVIGTDRPGLLAELGAVFKSFDLPLLNARISTLGERAEDVFFIVDHNNQPLEDDALCSKIQQALTQVLENGASQA